MISSLFHIGCAGWSIPAVFSAQFPSGGTHLERYASRFGAVEINSSFYRPHRPQTYAKWAASVPDNFRFAVKIPKLITHERRLRDVEAPLQRFLDESGELGAKLGPLLTQLPPSFSFDEALAADFFALLRQKSAAPVVCEPRHRSWFTPQADELLAQFQVARVAADPALLPVAAMPGGWKGLRYYRLHGSPHIYYSAYSPAFLGELAATIQNGASSSVWCIFDNTAAGAAANDALRLLEHLA